MYAAHRAGIISYRFLNDLTRTRRLMGSIRNRTNFVSKTHTYTHILRSVYNIIYRILYHISIEEALYRRRVQCTQRRKLFFFPFPFQKYSFIPWPRSDELLGTNFLKALYISRNEKSHNSRSREWFFFCA